MTEEDRKLWSQS